MTCGTSSAVISSIMTLRTPFCSPPANPPTFFGLSTTCMYTVAKVCVCFFHWYISQNLQEVCVGYYKLSFHHKQWNCKFSPVNLRLKFYIFYHKTHLFTSKIHMNNRFMRNNGSECLMTIAGADFQIQEPSPFNPIWFSHKFNAAALRYEVGVCIQAGWIVCTAGPFPAGDFPDM